MKYYNIPIFVPHLGCPFECVFCNQRKITGVGSNVDETVVNSVINEHLKLLENEECKIEIAFFGGSFTGIGEELQERLLSCASSYVGHSNITGIRVSTRPDYINHDVLKRLVKYKVSTVELGVQSMDEEVLKSSCRGHSAEDVKMAVELIRQYPIQLGLQMMTGLPGDTPEKSIATAKEFIRLKPDIVRIYPTLVIGGTFLERMYNLGEYTPQSVEAAVELCHTLLKMFSENNIKVIRIGLQNTEEISLDGAVVAGPFHPAFGELVESAVYFDKIEEVLKNTSENELVFEVHSSEVSKAVGHKRANIIKAQEIYNKKIRIEKNPCLKKGEICRKR